MISTLVRGAEMCSKKLWKRVGGEIGVGLSKGVIRRGMREIRAVSRPVIF